MLKIFLPITSSLFVCLYVCMYVRTYVCMYTYTCSLPIQPPLYISLAEILSCYSLDSAHTRFFTWHSHNETNTIQMYSILSLFLSCRGCSFKTPIYRESHGNL
uniref:Uncharacterized protein n=1 Tax=Octopus bimaculoides TaxID=37653 RepID=A0A0L8IGV9_OCTBM